VRRHARSVAIAVLGGVLLSACGSDNSEPRSSDDGDPVPEGKIVVTTKEGSALEFSEFEIDCHTAEGDQDGPPIEWPAVGAVSGSNDRPGISMREPRLHIEVVAEIVDGDTVELYYPNIEATGDLPPVNVYVSRTGGRATELSSGAEGSVGEIHVIKASCEPKPVLELRVDGDLYSESWEGGHGLVRGHITLD
jgi:hypothetical protein